MLSCIPCSRAQASPPPTSHSGQSGGETALNFELKFELDCTRCLWNNYQSVQAKNNTAGFNLHDNDEIE